MSVEETGARMRKDQSQNPEQVDTSAFEKELSATLQWLTEETSASHPFGDCPETEAIVSHFRNAPRPEVEQHLKDCAKCADLSQPFWTSVRPLLERPFGKTFNQLIAILLRPTQRKQQNPLLPK